MHEYDAIRGEVQTTLSSQVAILSFGSATVGLLVAAAAALWTDQAALTSLILLFGVPLTCFLTLAVYTGELVRLMRAGLFLNHLECAVNNSFLDTVPRVDEDQRPSGRPELVLTWEQWRNIRKGRGDVDKLNRIAISLVFLVLAVGFTLAGYLRLHTAPDISETWATVGLLVSIALGAIFVLWITYLVHYAYSYRKLYRYFGRTPPPASLPDSSHRLRTCYCEDWPVP